MLLTTAREILPLNTGRSYTTFAAPSILLYEFHEKNFTNGKCRAARPSPTPMDTPSGLRPNRRPGTRPYSFLCGNARLAAFMEDSSKVEDSRSCTCRHADEGLRLAPHHFPPTWYGRAAAVVEGRYRDHIFYMHISIRKSRSAGRPTGPYATASRSRAAQAARALVSSGPGCTLRVSASLR